MAAVIATDPTIALVTFIACCVTLLFIALYLHPWRGTRAEPIGTTRGTVQETVEITRSTGSFIADGLARGSEVRVNGRLWRVSAVTPSVLTLEAPDR